MKAATRFTVKYLVVLWFCCLLGWLGVNGLIIAAGRIPLWQTDGVPLYLNFMIFEGRALRSALHALFTGGGFSFPVYTFDLGYGADVLLTLGGSLNDPFNLLTVFVPTRFMVWLYVVLVVVRVCLAATSFSAYCFHRGNGRKATFVAALCYVFCGYVLFWGILRHPNFINWSILLPLVLLGADKLFEGRSGLTFLVAMALQFLTSIYFAYMTCLILLGYCLIKYFLAPRKRSARDFLRLVGRFLLLLGIAFCIAASVVIPLSLNIMSQTRVSSGSDLDLLCNLYYYMRLPIEAVGGAMVTRGVYIGAVGIVLFLVFLLCGKRFDPEVWRAWCFGAVLVAVCTCVPFFWSMFNGFGYQTDRWMLVYGFVLSYIACMAIPMLEDLKKQERIRVAKAFGGFSVFVLAMIAYDALISQVQPEKMIWPCAALFFSVGVAIVVLLSSVRLNERRPTGYLALLVLGNAMLVVSFYVSPLGKSAGAEFSKAGAARQYITSTGPAAVMETLDVDTPVRFSAPVIEGRFKNNSLNHGVMGITFYSSFYNQYVDDFRKELGLSDHYLDYCFSGSDSRTAIDWLTGAEYFVAKGDEALRVPYGYDEIGVTENGYSVWRTDAAFPIAFVSNKGISRNTYDSLDAVQKQEALLQGVVVDDAVLQGIETVNPTIRSQCIAYELEADKGILLEQDEVRVLKANAKLRLRFEGEERSETYVHLAGLGYRSCSPKELGAIAGKPISGIRPFWQNVMWSPSTSYGVTVSSGERVHPVSSATVGASGYSGKDDWVVNLGYSEEGLHEAELSFSRTGVYSLSSLEVVCQPVGALMDHSAGFQRDAVRDLKLGNDGIVTGHMTSETDSPIMAVFTIPYSEGWSAMVDGKPVEVFRVDTAFMGLRIEGAGDHDIQLRYRTPGRVIGSLLSLFGIAIGLGVVVHEIRHRTARQDSRM